ncbi:MAG: beta-ketoacyl-ACP synthase III [Anaerolineae bacterium]|nr:beta-ketoacyl-ACP synthase III [Anaerolineae bacterium]
MGRYAQIIGWGKSVPNHVLTNEDLARIVDTSDEWIRTHTGIRQRYIATDPRETTATLAIKAAQEALRVADVPASRLDMIIVATASPEHIFPSTASLVQDGIGATRAGAFDLSAACSGFVYALSVARGLIVSGSAEYVLVIGSETLSRLVDWSDRNTCVLFGDGAGAVLLAASEVPGGILSTVLGSDGSGGNLLIVPAGGSRMPTCLETVASGMHYLKMNGREVFRFATRVMARAAQEAAEQAGLTMDDIDLLIPHQANRRIIESAMKQLKLDESRVFINIDRYGNTSAASIPIALCEAIEEGRIKQNDHLILVGFGGGLTWGAAAVQWSVPLPLPETPWWRAAQRSGSFHMAQVRSLGRRALRRLHSIAAGSEEENGRQRQSSLGEGLQKWRARLWKAKTAEDEPASSEEKPS